MFFKAASTRYDFHAVNRRRHMSCDKVRTFHAIGMRSFMRHVVRKLYKFYVFLLNYIITKILRTKILLQGKIYTQYQRIHNQLTNSLI